MDTIKLIEQSPDYQLILKESFGGVMYNVANRGKYETSTIVGLWDSMTETERNSAGGIMKGVFNFLKEREV